MPRILSNILSFFTGLSWKGLYRLLGILIVWIIAGFAFIYNLGRGSIAPAFQTLLIGIIASAVIFIVITIIDKIISDIPQE